MLIFGVLAELNAQNAQKQPVSCPQLSPSLDDEASDTRSTTGNQEATAQVHSAAPCVSANTGRKLNLQTQLGFKDKRGYNDFRVYYYFSFTLTVDLGAGSYD